MPVSNAPLPVGYLVDLRSLSDLLFRGDFSLLVCYSVCCQGPLQDLTSNQHDVLNVRNYCASIWYVVFHTSRPVNPARETMQPGVAR